MNPNNTKRAKLRSNMMSVNARLAKIYAIDLLNEDIQALKKTEFTEEEVIKLVHELWNTKHEQ